MTQRKLDTIKRHTIRRHAELLSMSDMERQRLYHDLVAHHFRRGGDPCPESDCFSVSDGPKLRTTGSKAEVRRHQRLSPDFPPSVLPNRIGSSRRCEVEKALFMNPQSSSEQFIHHTKPSIAPAPPMNLKLVENILSNEQIHSVFTKYLMGFHPNQVRENLNTFLRVKRGGESWLFALVPFAREIRSVHEPHRETKSSATHVWNGYPTCFPNI